MTEADVLKYGRASLVHPPKRKVFVFGPEGATNYPLVRDRLNKATWWFEDVVLFTRSEEYDLYRKQPTGTGALAQRWADERYNRYFTYTYHPWPEVYGEAKAGEKRDELLLEDLVRGTPGVAVAFDDGQDLVVDYLRKLCRYYEVKVKTIKYEDG